MPEPKAHYALPEELRALSRVLRLISGGPDGDTYAIDAIAHDNPGKSCGRSVYRLSVGEGGDGDRYEVGEATEHNGDNSILSTDDADEVADWIGTSLEGGEVLTADPAAPPGASAAFRFGSEASERCQRFVGTLTGQICGLTFADGTQQDVRILRLFAKPGLWGRALVRNWEEAMNKDVGDPYLVDLYGELDDEAKHHAIAVVIY